MKIPNKITIGAHEFKIVKRKMDDMFGECDSEALTITIDSTKPQTQQEETFFHEVLHAQRKLLGQELKDEDEEEKVVQALGHLTYQFLITNKLI